jgi:tetratricopeptide (TPR) repeat protein
VKRAQGHLDEAIADHSKSIDLDPSLPEAHANRGFARREKGLLRPALEDFETALKVASPHWPRRPATEKILEALAPHVLCLEGEALLEGDKYREAICKFAEVVKRWPKSEFAVPAAYNCACGHTLLGEKEIALDWLEKTVELGLARTEIGRFEDNPTFDPLRDDERYKKLIAKLKGK